MKVFAISDLHVDYLENRNWLAHLSRQDFKDDILILAGDLSDDPSLIADSFSLLTGCFNKVLFVPGNHDLWVVRSKETTSFEKFDKICGIAREAGVYMSPVHCGSLTIVPLLGWYDYSFGLPSDQLRTKWRDYRTCYWGELNNRVDAITNYFTKKNEPHLSINNGTVISFSHFLPRIDVMPDRIPSIHRQLYPVLGSNIIESQIRQLQSSIHVYGHSHVNRRVEIDNVTYINNAFGSPRETRISAKQLKCIYEASA